MTDQSLFHGVHVVLYAFFKSDGSLDEAAMESQFDWVLSSGCRGVNILGLATEVQKLASVERRHLLDMTTQKIAGKLTVSATIPGNSVAEQVALAEHARTCGVDFVILQPPTVGAFSAETYIRFFESVAKQIDLPVGIQNAPQFLGRSLSAKDIIKMKDSCANIACVKSEEPALIISDLVATVGTETSILGGRGGLEITDSLRAGCSGFVLAPDIAETAVQICKAWAIGDFAKAEEVYGKAAPAMIFAMQSLEHLITYGKRIFAQRIGIEVYDRQPARMPSQFGLSCAAHWARHLDEISISTRQKH